VGDLVPWSVVAMNLAEHAGNPIHTDVGARAAGFPAALVAGVTTYAYLTHPLAAGWGLDWIGGGGGEVRFRAPVFQGDTVMCVPTEIDGVVVVEARVGEDNKPRAMLRARRTGEPPRTPRPGERLPSRRVELSEEFSADYGARAGDDLDLYWTHGIAHPAVWPALANRVVHAELVRGSWIHVRSRIDHHGLAPVGSTVEVHAVVIDRFYRSGERAVVDIAIELDGRPIASIEHEAIISLPGAA
jgi:acyl dehydratase